VITRRRLVFGSIGLLAGTSALSGYAFGVEPLLRLVTTRYRLTPKGWTPGLKLRICALADIHAVNPGMTAERIATIVARTNALRPDVTVLLGDYTRGRTHGWPIPPAEWAGALSGLQAPLGVHAILGNHDWWDDPVAQSARHGPTASGLECAATGIAVYHNRSVRLEKDGKPLWLAGLGDQIALLPRKDEPRPRRYTSLADLDGTLAQITDQAPVVLLAHEPDIFTKVPDRVSLMLSGHTHGGQVRLFGYSPIVPSRYGNRYAYGHVVENGRNLIVSGGLGCSILPVRLGMPPEIVVIDLGGGEDVA